MKGTIGLLVMAAALEIGGDAAVRRGLIHSAWPWVLLGAATLATYGLVVNLNRSVAFGRLMGAYIAVFFLVSQILSAAFFAERPSLSLIVGGTLIVAGGLIIQLGTP
jgi:drug/metabolite transporter superfamily protein YnfA